MRKQKPSRTALKIAMAIVTLSAKPGMAAVIPAGAVEATEKLLVASGAVSERIVRWARTRRMASFYDAFDWMLPGMFASLGQRKAFCERQVRDGIAAGATQVLVLGAGYDTLGWRLAPEFPGVRFHEIDHPATARLKRRGIEALGRRPNLVLAAEDLGERQLSEVLAELPGWDSSVAAVFVAEGLVMYLPPQAVPELFRQCAAGSGPGSRIAFTYIPTGADGRPDVGPWSGLMLWLQGAVGEPWTFSIRPQELGPFLAAAGWRDASATAFGAGKRGVEYYAAAVLHNAVD